MSEYVLIESRDPFECAQVRDDWRLAEDLSAAGHRVALYLVQNGVLPARPGAQAPELAALSRAGVEVLADDFSLRERAIPADRLAGGVEAAPIATLVDRLAAGCKALWL